MSPKKREPGLPRAPSLARVLFLQGKEIRLLSPNQGGPVSISGSDPAITKHEAVERHAQTSHSVGSRLELCHRLRAEQVKLLSSVWKSPQSRDMQKLGHKLRGH